MTNILRRHMQGGSQKKVRFRFFPPAFPVDREPPDLVLQAPLVRRPGEFVAGCGPETLVARREEGSQGFSLGNEGFNHAPFEVPFPVRQSEVDSRRAWEE